MDEKLVRELATQIVDQAVLSNYKFYLVVVGLSVLSSAITVFVGAYLRKRGENFATKQDFQNILEQVRQTTTTTEEIRSEIASQKNLEEEKRRTLREKLEHIFQETYSLELWLEKARSAAINAEVFDINASPLATIEMLQRIYFVDCEEERNRLVSTVYPMIKWCLTVRLEALKATEEKREIDVDLKEFSQMQPEIQLALSALRDSLLDKYSDRIGL